MMNVKNLILKKVSPKQLELIPLNFFNAKPAQAGTTAFEIKERETVCTAFTEKKLFPVLFHKSITRYIKN